MLVSIFRSALRIAVVLAIAWLIHLLARWAMLESAAMAGKLPLHIGLLVLLLLIYATLIAIPFVPGVELGIALLVLQGPAAAPWVWLATVLGLTLAYLAGAWLPAPGIAAALRDVRLSRAAAMVEAIAPLDAAARSNLLAGRLPGWLAASALRHRYVVLAVLITLPGNVLLGGGGGIGLIAGLSRIYAPLPTLITFALAVSPVPLAFWFLGTPALEIFN